MNASRILAEASSPGIRGERVTYAA
jgi:hypothetical protein